MINDVCFRTSSVIALILSASSATVSCVGARAAVVSISTTAAVVLFHTRVLRVDRVGWFWNRPKIGTHTFVILFLRTRVKKLMKECVEERKRRGSMTVVR